MKIGFISDIHIDFFPNDFDVHEEFLKSFSQCDIDMLVIAGDISNNYKNTISFVKNLNNKLSYDVYYVPGNHDMWNKKVDDSTLEIYEAYKQDDNCLVNKTVHLIDDVYLIGDVFWYDYTFADQSFDINTLVSKTHGKRVWQDSIYVDWKTSDREVSQKMIEKAKKRIEDNPEARYILVSHMINHKDFTVNPEWREEWEFFNGFLGSENIYHLIKEANIDIAVCGHVHFRRVINEDDKKFICCCLSYPKEWKLFDDSSDELSYHIQAALEVVEI